MNAIRKILGAFVIIVFGLPLLFGIIWAVGLTRAAVSPEFASELPQEIIDEIPDLVDETFKEAQREDVITDEETRAWIQAAAKVDTSPRELMEEIGLIGWMRNELSDSLYELGEVLRGEVRPKRILIDLDPLKGCLRHPAIEEYVLQILQHLPPCDEEGKERWIEFALGDYDELPPCRPEDTLAVEAVRGERERIIAEMEDEIEIFEGAHYFPFGISRVVNLFSFFMFLIPAVFIFLGSLLAASSASSFLRWSGISTLIGGLSALVLSLFTKNIIAMTYGLVPPWHAEYWSSEVNEVLLDKALWIGNLFIDRLISPVVSVSGIVCIFGVLLFALSFVVRKP